ncbi:MAG: hypothetical protein M1836_007757 [Candelina mexicana]|nr:MAG: hypothetical protein M1836_007757 [Candelina mexicana]
MAANPFLANVGSSHAHSIQQPITSNDYVVRGIIQQWEKYWPDFFKVSSWMALCTETAAFSPYQNSVIKQLQLDLEVKTKELQRLEPLSMFEEVVDIATSGHTPPAGSDCLELFVSMWEPDSHVVINSLTIRNACLYAVHSYKKSGTCDCPVSVPGKARVACNVCSFKDKKERKARKARKTRKARSFQDEDDHFSTLASRSHPARIRTALEVTGAADADTAMNEN